MQCHFCGKSYRNDKLLSNHVIACKIINDYHKKNEIVDEIHNNQIKHNEKHIELLNVIDANKNDTDSKLDMLFSLVNNLTQELHSHKNIVCSQKDEIDKLNRYCVRLEDQIKTIKHENNFNNDYISETRKKKKLSVFQWLIKHFPEPMTFNEWIDKIEVTYEDMLNLIDSDFTSGMLKIMLKNLNKFNRKEDLPIRAFKNRQGCIYAFTENHKWEFITAEHMENMGLAIQRQLIKHFKEYDKGLTEDEKYVNNNKYLIYNDRILANGCLERKVSIVKNRLYENIKKSIKDTLP